MMLAFWLGLSLSGLYCQILAGGLAALSGQGSESELGESEADEAREDKEEWVWALEDKGEAEESDRREAEEARLVWVVGQERCELKSSSSLGA